MSMEREARDLQDEEHGLVPVGDRSIQGYRPQQSLTEQIQDVLAASMHLSKFQRQVVEAAVTVTNENDWNNLGGKPYLSEAGAMKAASVLPIEVFCIEKPCKTWADDDEGRFYLYMCEYGARWKGGLGSVSATGTCSSRDKFFSMKDGERLPQSKIDETNLIKKCATNGRRNAIVRLLGLQNLTWEEVSGFGIDQTKVSGTNYDGKRKQKDEGNGEAAAAHLEQLTVFEGRDGKHVKGRTNVKYLSEKQAVLVLGRLRTEYETWKKKTE
jgi:hypothetical protein